MADARLTPARPDLAAARLRGVVEAARFAEPELAEVIAPAAPLTFAPAADARMETELLHGEAFEVYERRGGWAWGQASRDGYVGYVPESALGEPGPAASHRVRALTAHLYPEPDMKTRPIRVLSIGSQVRGGEERNGFIAVGGGWLARPHLAPSGGSVPDWVAEAARWRGISYLWGGRSGFGVDCSGLIQAALHAAGRECPRDSDMQEAALGRDLGPDEPPERGDIVFWKGHVGVMHSATEFLHANAHHMAVALEPWSGALARIGPPTRRARLDG